MTARTAGAAGLRVEVQYASRRPWVPTAAAMRRWARAACAAGMAGPGRRGRPRPTPSLLCIRVAGPVEARRLNREYRDRDRPTNVLSFPASAQEVSAAGVLGDLVICPSVVAREARQQGKRREAHWAHMVVHGTLHLLGYQHENARQARRMERLEVEILGGLGYQDPYVEPDAASA